jgi:hypothetical protein
MQQIKCRNLEEIWKKNKLNEEKNKMREKVSTKF